MLESDTGAGQVTRGAWIAQVDPAGPDADSYTRARISRDALLPLGAGEGLGFSAKTDTDGRALRTGCSYRVEGLPPPARLWTIFVTDLHGQHIGAPAFHPTTLHSRQVGYRADGAISISVSAHAQSGDWLALAGSPGKEFRIGLNAYDTPVATGAGLGDLILPTITRTDCDG